MHVVVSVINSERVLHSTGALLLHRAEGPHSPERRVLATARPLSQPCEPAYFTETAHKHAALRNSGCAQHTQGRTGTHAYNKMS